MYNPENFISRISSVKTLKLRVDYVRLYAMFLALIREFLGPSPSAFYEKKARIIAGDITVGT